MELRDLGTQALTVGAGALGGSVGYFLGGRRMLWTVVGAVVGAVVVPPVASAATSLLPSGGGGATYPEQLEPGATIIRRAAVGDTLVVHAPSGWGVPAANANIPGFLEVQSSDPAEETTTLLVVSGGQGQIQMQLQGQTAVLSVEAT